MSRAAQSLVADGWASPMSGERDIDMAGWPGRAPDDAVLPAPPPADWSSWYLSDEDDMGQSPLHWDIVVELYVAFKELSRKRAWQSRYVCCDQFVAWVEGHPEVRVSPDLYVIDDPPAEIPSSWQTWLPGHKAPRFAVEVVSDGNWSKDYEDSRRKYESMGAAELLIADPYAFLHPEACAPIGRKRRRRADKERPERVPLQVYRKNARGALRPVAGGAGPLYCAEVDVYVLFCKTGEGQARLRLSRDEAGQELVLTPEEYGRVLERERDALRADRDAARARAHTLQVERDAATNRAHALQAERDALQVERDALQVERDAATNRAHALQVERDAATAQARAAEELLRKHGLLVTGPEMSLSEIRKDRPSRKRRR